MTPHESPAGELDSNRPIPFRDALRTWTWIGLHSFGGPAGQIAVMHERLVEELEWIDEERFLHALQYCMLLPGPEAQQLATYIGWRLHGLRGGLAAGILFVLPGALVMYVLAAIYASAQDLSLVQALFAGIKPVVLAIVIEAVLRIGKRALKQRVSWLIAASAFAALALFDVPFPLVILAAGLVGLFLRDSGPDLVREPAPTATWRTSALTLCVGLALWFAPLALVALASGTQSVFFQEGLFFSKCAVVTFGGAYAVLSYVSNQAVHVHGWLRAGQMLDGLGLAETTPGPLILVVQFVAFLGAYQHPGILSPLVAGVLGASLALWVTFVPSMLWIFLGAPWIERLRSLRALRGALAAITAAVVGVILNLAVWFALHVLFAHVDDVHSGALHLWVPEWSTLSWPAALFALVALWAMLRAKLGLAWTIAGGALAGVCFYALGIKV